MQFSEMRFPEFIIQKKVKKQKIRIVDPIILKIKIRKKYGNQEQNFKNRKMCLA